MGKYETKMLQADRDPIFQIDFKTDYKTIINFHSHEGYEIVWLTNGEANYIFENKVYRLTKGQVLFFKSSELHKVRLKEGCPYERVVLMFTEEFFSFQHPIFTNFQQFFEENKTPHYALHFYTWKADRFQHIIDQLLHEDGSNQLWERKSALELYMLELLLFLGREVMAETETERPLYVVNSSVEKEDMLERVLQEIALIWNTQWRLEDLAQRLHINKYYLCHFFKKEFGVTVHQYILQRRMYEAKKLLVYTNIPINQIAEKVGFLTASNFIRTFKKHILVTPKKFRNNETMETLEFT
ncbi:helix-turn-helix domain-containing protein [Evansella sp. AB-rgal1]|uniref:AraC family transcriptional regulator n=1 Tax=Evansella sp. AB-rgal1 TaxID=3242696 RepID=UPI00359CE36B